MRRCVRRDINKVGVIRKWRELAEDRGKWRSVVIEAGEEDSTIGLHPFMKGRKEYPNHLALCSVIGNKWHTFWLAETLTMISRVSLFQ